MWNVITQFVVWSIDLLITKRITRILLWYDSLMLNDGNIFDLDEISFDLHSC